MRKIWVKFLGLGVITSLAGACSTIFTYPEPKTEVERLAELSKLGAWPTDQEVQVFWHKNMIPFISAETDSDCAFALGVIQAHLRLGQMEMFRILSAGRLAEGAGPIKAPEIDALIRTFNLQKSAELAYTQLSAQDRLWLESFVKGVNFFIEKSAVWPIESRFLDIKPEAWTAIDALRVGRLASSDATWSTYLAFLQMRGQPGWEKIWDEFIRYGQASMASFRADEALSIDTVLQSTGRAGSNSIVVGGGKTASGSALIASDPHLGIFAPNLWILLGYKSPSYHTMGFAFPAVPAIAMGRNQDIAWGGTYMRGISSFLMKVSDHELTGTRQETIKKRYGWDTTLSIRESEKGPILSDLPGLKQTGENIALNWVGHQPSDELGAFLSANRAQNWEQFQRAFDNYAVAGLNMTYADRRGNIGMLLGIRQPILKKPEEQFDLVKSADNAVVSFRGPRDLPRIYNPSAQFLVSANNMPTKIDPQLAFVFGDNDRVTRLNTLIDQARNVDASYLKRVQQDVFSAQGLNLKNWILQRIVDDRPASLGSYVQRLKAWDGNYDQGSEGAVAFEILTWRLALDLFEKEFSREDLKKEFLGSEDWRLFLQDRLQQLNEKDAQAAILAAMLATNSSVKDLPTWGDMHVQTLQNPLGLVPVLGRRFRFGEYPAPGASNTVHKARFQPGFNRRQVIFGAQVRHISDLSSLDENYFVMLGGNDGWLSNPHLIDQAELWRKGEYLRLPLSLEGVKKEFQLAHMRFGPAFGP